MACNISISTKRGGISGESKSEGPFAEWMEKELSVDGNTTTVVYEKR